MLLNDKLPRFMKAIDKRLEGDDKRFLIGHELNIADFALGSFFM